MSTISEPGQPSAQASAGRLSLEHGYDGPANMARDFALLQEAESRGWAARVYSWSEPWVTLGKFQDPETDLIPECPVPYVIRPTGGRGVLHGHDVTIGLALSLGVLSDPSQPLESISRSVRLAYRLAVGPILNALSSCGIEACLGEDLPGRSAGPRSADCFAAISANDVVDRRTLKKVCGVAMLLTQRAVLLQASIPAGPPLVALETVYGHPAQPYWVSIKAGVFAGALEQCLKQQFGPAH